MKSALLFVSATALTTLALVLSAAPAAQAPAAVSLTGTWHGTGHDNFVRGVNPNDGMTVTWVLTQIGSTVSGTVKTEGLNGNDGSCSGCHRDKTGTVSGTLSGTTLTSLTMDFPGNNGEITSLCTATFSNTAPATPDTMFTLAYSGTDSCEAPVPGADAFTGGSLVMTREPETLASINTQPASQLIASGRIASLSVAATGTAPLTYQWYSGPSGTTSNPIGGAISAAYTTPAITTATNLWVRVSNAYGSSVDSTTATLMPYQAFTDNVLTAGSSLIRAAHILELRTRIDALRARFGLAAYAYADAALTAGTTSIRAQHIIDLRNALSEAYVAAGRVPPAYADSSLASGVVIKREHIAGIRTAVVAIE